MISKNIPKQKVEPLKNESEKPPDKIPSPADIVAHLDQSIIGQDETKRTLASACYCHLHACAVAESNGEVAWPDNHTLIAGPSGSGKSEMIKVLCAYLKIPYYQIDCTNLTPNGYRGRNMESVINDMEQKLVKEDESTPACLVIWDEIDKLVDDGSEAGRYHRMTQADCLKLIESGKVSDNLNTTKILHVGCGAFVGMDKIRFPLATPIIGFNPSPIPISDSTRTTKIEAQHFIKFGLIPEFVGRFSRFSAMSQLLKSDMVKIMTESKISFLRRKIEQFERHGTKLIFSDEAIDELANIAITHPSGARGLRQLISQALAPWDYQLADLGSRGIREIHYDKASIYDGSKAQVVMGTPFQVLPVVNEISELPEEKTIDEMFVF
jgi:ATP-dependent Clp protease ATP-binding subunit ClpX